MVSPACINPALTRRPARFVTTEPSSPIDKSRNDSGAHGQNPTRKPLWFRAEIVLCAAAASFFSTPHAKPVILKPRLGDLLHPGGGRHTDLPSAIFDFGARK